MDQDALIQLAYEVMNNKTYTEAITEALKITNENHRFFVIGFIEGAWDTAAGY